MPNKRETFKDIEEGGRKWRIGKWNARLAQYWINKLVIGAREPGKKEVAMDSVISMISQMGKADFFEFQADCLSACSELTKMADGQVVPVPVLRVDGTFNVDDLEYDNQTVMALTFSAFTFSVQDSFFDEKGSGESGSRPSDSHPSRE